MSERPLLELRSVRKQFRRRRLGGRRGSPVVAVADVSLSVARRETVALVGESGSGKTTTGLCALRLLEPDGGAVLFDGEDVLAMDRRRLRNFRSRAQIVFQDAGAALNPRRSAGATVEEVLRLHGGVEGREGRRRRADELLVRVGLRPEDGSRFPHEMSGGERQRLGIARSLAVEPELLVLDEPVASLDASVQATVMALLASLRDDLGLAYLLIAHDLSLVESFASRVAVMREGRIVEEGLCRKVFTNPSHPYSQGLLEAIPGLHKRTPKGRGPAAPGG